MRYDFDTPINRRNTFSFKWDCDMDYFGRDDVIHEEAPRRAVRG